ncbi:DUF6665 family protein [Pelagibacterium luteolum]|uniref:Uncharacterized protein n=1 Tax=Pelagibacterium luteolum TaxID=440168 RepID=A0A1G7YCC0_9HYPH|nr:DUF6665 family protein [Pelagibacterium luteolum]SDG94182.1 hypothetical protein SAMN04487974_11353 [Pelagibacterium luteolum]
MTLRDSLDLIKAVNPEGGHAVLEHEIMAERASSLGAAEKRVQLTVSAYNASEKPDRSQELAAAQKAVWGYFVQRELCGFRRHQDVIAAFSIPSEVLNGLGAVR